MSVPGNIVAISTFFDGLKVQFETDLPAGIGGAPVFNFQGEVIGIVYSGHLDGRTNSVSKRTKNCITNKAILDFINSKY